MVVFAINSIAMININEFDKQKIKHCFYIYQLFSVAMRLFVLFDLQQKMNSWIAWFVGGSTKSVYRSVFRNGDSKNSVNRPFFYSHDKQISYLSDKNFLCHIQKIT